MSYEARLRLLTSLGLGVLIAVGGSITAYLFVQAAELFGWQVIAAGVVITAAITVLVDLLTPIQTQ